MTDQEKPQKAQPSLATIAVDDAAIKEKILAAREELLKEGVITETFGNRLEEFAKKADLGIRIRVPRDLLSAKLVRLGQMDDFSWANNFFEILLALSTTFFGAFIGYLTTNFRFDLTATLLLIFSIVLSGLTLPLFLRRNALKKEMLKEENFVSILEKELRLGELRREPH